MLQNVCVWAGGWCLAEGGGGWGGNLQVSSPHMCVVTLEREAFSAYHPAARGLHCQPPKGRLICILVQKITIKRALRVFLEPGEYLTDVQSAPVTHGISGLNMWTIYQVHHLSLFSHSFIFSPTAIKFFFPIFFFCCFISQAFFFFSCLVLVSIWTVTSLSSPICVCMSSLL